MSSSSAVVVPTSPSGAPQASQAAAVTSMKGGALVLSPLPLGGGKRKTKKVPKKILKLFKKGSAKTLKRLMKGGQTAEQVVTGGEVEGEEMEGARRRRGSRKGSRKSRRHGFLY